MFFKYLLANIKFAFTTWIVLTLLNQIVFFGACLAPYCILASIPHVSLITLGIMYLSYKTALDTYDPKTGYNQFGYDKDSYDQYGYGLDGYDKYGYDIQGLDRDGKDRLGKGSLGRFFSSSEHKDKILKMNKDARNQNKAEQAKKHSENTIALKTEAESTDKQISEDLKAKADSLDDELKAKREELKAKYGLVA